MQKSDVTSTEGTLYPDIMTFPIDDFKFTDVPMEYYLTEIDIYRFDVLLLKLYDVAEMDDILFWLNNIPFIYDEADGTKILIPSRKDMEDFYLKNLA
jgi:hypothetical protein